MNPVEPDLNTETTLVSKDISCPHERRAVPEVIVLISVEGQYPKKKHILQKQF